jgi:hypothetical protein
MKKLIFILLLLIGGLVVSAQSDSSQYVTNSNVEKLIDKYGGKLEATVISIAQTLKQPTEHVYEVLVKQQVVKSIQALIIIVAWLLFTFLTIFFATGVADWDDFEAKKDRMAASGGLFAMSLILFFVFTIVLLVQGSLNNVVTGFVNPEYGAMNDIVNWLR